MFLKWDIFLSSFFSAIADAVNDSTHMKVIPISSPFATIWKKIENECGGCDTLRRFLSSKKFVPKFEYQKYFFVSVSSSNK